MDTHELCRILQTLRQVMCFSGAYAGASEDADEMVSACIAVLNEKEKCSPKCCKAAMEALQAMVFRAFCRDNAKFQPYEDVYLKALKDGKGSGSLFSETVDWRRSRVVSVGRAIRRALRRRQRAPSSSCS